MVAPVNSPIFGQLSGVGGSRPPLPARDGELVDELELGAGGPAFGSNGTSSRGIGAGGVKSPKPGAVAVITVALGTMRNGTAGTHPFGLSTRPIPRSVAARSAISTSVGGRCPSVVSGPPRKASTAGLTFSRERVN
jgi:hypothetical protein